MNEFYKIYNNLLKYKQLSVNIILTDVTHKSTKNSHFNFSN